MTAASLIRRPTRQRRSGASSLRGRVALVSHEASLTGAPRVAGETLAALHSHGFETVVVHRWGGPLQNHLDARADQSGFEPFGRFRVELRRHRRARGLAIRLETFAALLVLLRYRPSLVWCNTTLSACYVRPAQRLKIPVVLHVHEMRDRSEPILRRYRLDAGDANRFDNVALVACSDAAADDLAAITKLERSRISVLTSPTDVTAIRARSMGRSPDPAFVTVIGCGTANAMKGVDTFATIARAIRELDHPQIRFRWIGKIVEAEALPPGDSVEFLGEVEDATARIAEGDILLVPTRADAFPLVVLEAMALSKPIIAYSVGGIPEQLGDAGVLVTPGDTEQMCAELVALAGDPERRAELGRRAATRVAELWDIGPFRLQVGALAAPSRAVL